MDIKKVSSHVMFDGEQFKFKHKSSSLECEMTFSVYLPSQANSQDVPIIYWLSGLTCTDDNFVQKSGAQKYAAENGRDLSKFLMLALEITSRNFLYRYII